MVWFQGFIFHILKFQRTQEKQACVLCVFDLGFIQFTNELFWICGHVHVYVSIVVWDNLVTHDSTNINWPKCNHSICDYMRLLVICNYIWTFLQLFFVLVIFAITLQLICTILVFIHPCEQHLIWISFKKNNLCPINYKCDQFSCNLISIQKWILCNNYYLYLYLYYIFILFTCNKIFNFNSNILLHNDDHDDHDIKMIGQIII